MSLDPGLRIRGCSGMKRRGILGFWRRGVQSGTRDKAGSHRALQSKVSLNIKEIEKTFDTVIRRGQK